MKLKLSMQQHKMAGSRAGSRTLLPCLSTEEGRREHLQCRILPPLGSYIKESSWSHLLSTGVILA